MRISGKTDKTYRTTFFMRSSKSRSRNNKNRQRPTGNIVNRVFDSSGPDGKVRGTPQQIIDKYNQLHRDATLAGDRVDAENFAQHAEHYTRMLAEAQREMEARREEQDRQNRERQAERDRERAERQKAREAAGSEGGQSQSDDPGAAPQPEIVDGPGDGSGLVETPEAGGGQSENRRPRRSRGRAKSADAPVGAGDAAKAEEPADPAAPGPDTAEAAE